MINVMLFPETWEEFEASYGFTDSDEVYTNGARLIPSFRVEQWLEHTDQVKHGKWEFEPGIMYCSVCGWIFSYENGLEEEYEYCPHCGAMMERSESDEHSD